MSLFITFFLIIDNKSPLKWRITTLPHTNDALPPVICTEQELAGGNRRDKSVPFPTSSFVKSYTIIRVHNIRVERKNYMFQQENCL